MTLKSYPIYKGLQKPLVYKGLKGKYIYWALASLIFGLLVASITAAITNIITAALCSLVTTGSSIAFILNKQHKGPYHRKNYPQIFVQQTKLLIHYEKSK